MKLKEMFVAAPIHPLTYMFGAALSVLVSSIPSISLLITIAATTLPLTAASLISLVLILLATWLLSSCLGFVVAGYVNDPTRIGTIAPYTGAVLTTLPPVYYPLEAIPTQFWILALLPPTAHLSQLAKLVTGISMPTLNPLIYIASIILYLAAFTTLASFKSRWREK